jgi:hypothetical protein
MAFGLCNAFATFQRFMNNFLEPYIGLYVQVFLAIMSCIGLGMVIVAITKLSLQRKTSWRWLLSFHGVCLHIGWCHLGCVMPLEPSKGSWTNVWNLTLGYLFKCFWMKFVCMGAKWFIFTMIFQLISDGKCFFNLEKLSFLILMKIFLDILF